MMLQNCVAYDIVYLDNFIIIKKGEVFLIRTFVYLRDRKEEA